MNFFLTFDPVVVSVVSTVYGIHYRSDPRLVFHLIKLNTSSDSNDYLSTLVEYKISIKSLLSPELKFRVCVCLNYMYLGLMLTVTITTVLMLPSSRKRVVVAFIEAQISTV